MAWGRKHHRGAETRVEPGRLPHGVWRSKIKEQIEQGVAPWQKPWKPGEERLPKNIQTDKPYRGGNSVYLSVTQTAKGYSDNRWATYKQIKDMGGQVRKGEKATHVLFYKFDDQRQLFLPVAEDGIGRFMGDGGSSGGGGHERADGAHVAARGVAVDGEGAADVADAGGPVRRCVAVGGRAAAGGRYRRPAAGADAVQSAVPAASGSLSGGAATDATAAGPRLAGAVRPGPRGVLRAGGGSGSGSGVRLHRRERPGGDDTGRGVPASAVRVGAELQQVDVCGAGAERDVRGVGVGPAGRVVDAGRGPGSAATRQPVGGDARAEA